MRLLHRFKEACSIAQPVLEQGNYRWIPRTQAGWVIRIACTDVGQGAWVEAGQVSETATNQSQLSPGVKEQELSGKG